jgi:hypothetical protein
MVATTLILGSLDELHSGAVDPHRERSDHDPPARVAFPAHREPAGTEAREPPELAAIHRFGRRHEGPGAPRLHFHEHVSVAVTTDQVNLTKACALVSRNDGQTAAHKLDLSRALSREPKGTPFHRKTIGASLRRCDADDTVGGAVAGRQVQRSVGALPDGADAPVRAVEEDIALSRDRASEREAA